jgi:hypothetical protein
MILTSVPSVLQHPWEGEEAEGAVVGVVAVAPGVVVVAAVDREVDDVKLFLSSSSPPFLPITFAYCGHCLFIIPSDVVSSKCLIYLALCRENL